MTEPRIYWLAHDVTYRFETSPGDLEVTARLLPPTTVTQEVDHGQVIVEPWFADRNPITDRLGNAGTALRGRLNPGTQLRLAGQCRVVWKPAAVAPPRRTPPPRLIDRNDATEVVRDPSAEPLIRAYAAQTLGSGNVDRNQAAALMKAIRRDFAYDGTATDVTTSIDEFFRRCRGVCDDFVSLAGYCLGLYGVPTHRVVGYLVGRDAGGLRSRRLHAWIAVWFEDTGWLEFDPTIGQDPPSQHITLLHAAGRGDGAPVTGRVVSGNPVAQSVSERIELSGEID